MKGEGEGRKSLSLQYKPEKVSFGPMGTQSKNCYWSPVLESNGLALVSLLCLVIGKEPDFSVNTTLGPKVQ